MRRIVLLVVALSLAAGLPQAFAASKKAQEMRQANGLVRYTPSDQFLAGNFLADEINPSFIYGPVKKFATTRACKATWLIEEAEKNRVAGQREAGAPVEFTVYLEEDCPDKVIYYIFTDQSGFSPKQWIEWRQQFHKSKVEGQYGAVKAKLEKAQQDGVAVAAELRFIQYDGALSAKTPEEFVRAELKVAPVYDLREGRRIAR